MAITDITGIKDIIPSLDDQPIIADPVEAAHAAGLRYFTDARPGIRRKRAGKHFSYIAPNGERVSDAKTLGRIKSLAIPPAWTDVWICPSPNGHIQATGRDVKGRKQYRYHPRWRETRDETKYTRMIAFAEILPIIRDTTNRELSMPTLKREKVLATVVQLLDATAIRVGNEEYARDNQSFGLTTLRATHVDVEGSEIHFHFRGKSGKEHAIDVRDRRLARALQRLQDLPGQEVFQYLDGGQRHSVDSGDVNDYIRQITGENFTAKDFRTWHGTVSAAQALRSAGPFGSETEAKHNVVKAIEVAAGHLGNTPSICRKSYVHPAVINAYMDGSLISTFEQVYSQVAGNPIPGLHPEEVATLAVLQEELEKERQE